MQKPVFSFGLICSVYVLYYEFGKGSIAGSLK